MTPIRITTADLTAHLGYWLRYVSNHVSHAFAQKVEREGVTVAEWVIMRQLYGKEALSPSRLAKDLGLTRGAVSKLADRLLDKKLLTRRQSDDDGRAHTLALSSQGKKLVPRLAVLADRNDAEFFSSLSTQERRELVRMRRHIVDKQNLKHVPTS